MRRISSNAALAAVEGSSCPSIVMLKVVPIISAVSLYGSRAESQAGSRRQTDKSKAIAKGARHAEAEDPRALFEPAGYVASGNLDIV